MSGSRGYVYLLHLEGRIHPDHACRHYLGFTVDLRERIAQHRAGGSTAARLLQVAAERGIGFTVARVWKGDRGLERRIKRQKHAPAFCPVCGGRRWIDFADELSAAEVERLTSSGVLINSMGFAPPVFGFLDLAHLGKVGEPLALNGVSVLIFFCLVLAAVLAFQQMRRGGGGDDGA